MEVILSHNNLDFDGLASMVAAKKCYPTAKIVLPNKLNESVKQFLSIYKDSVEIIPVKQISWDQVNYVILVDTASFKRIGEIGKLLNVDQIEFSIYDHHQPSDQDIQTSNKTIDLVGASVTLLIEKIKLSDIEINSFEATIMALGLYSDTGSFSYASTTARDLYAASYLLERGANLAIITKFLKEPLLEAQQSVYQALLTQCTEFIEQGVEIFTAWHQQEAYVGGLANIVKKLIETTGSKVIFIIVEMDNKVFIIARSSTDQVNVLPIIKMLGGGGHTKAASATVKAGDLHEIVKIVNENIKNIVEPAITAKDMMSSPVKVISSDTTIDAAAQMMLTYGYTGLPIVENQTLVGIISRRDLDKAKHHGLGHAPVKGYMKTNPVTITPDVSIEEIQTLMIRHNIGRLPVMKKGQIVGIISRTNVIKVLHGHN